MALRRRPTPPSAATSRRDFIRTSWLVAGGAVVGGLSLARSAHAFGSDEIKVGLIGCGGRGTNAAVQALNTGANEQIQPNGRVRLIALADVFEDRLQTSLRTLRGHHHNLVDVPKDRQFHGLNGYQGLLQTDVDLVILATPPGFRPLHFDAAVQAGKHVFMEKPLATDAPGVRRILAANEQARQRDLTVAVGLQRHHERRYQETIQRLQDGAIGEILFTRVYWNGQGLGVRPRQPGWTELEHQLRNWHHFTWLSGDHIVERHIHNLDISNWLWGGPPAECQGHGGRQLRSGQEQGEIFDHHFVEYTYPNGAKMFSQCRQIPGCWNTVAEFAHGAGGKADISGAKIVDAHGQLVWRYGAKDGDGHQLEHDHLLAALRRGEKVNEVEAGARSTLTAIMGRLATYSGQVVTWDGALNSQLALADCDALHSLHDAAPVTPERHGTYVCAIPGQTVTV
jgi:myo-inositol 2-dehydrogenase / D-chiro-inositol 1-dehydrogenase